MAASHSGEEAAARNSSASIPSGDAKVGAAVNLEAHRWV